MKIINTVKEEDKPFLPVLSGRKKRMSRLKLRKQKRYVKGMQPPLFLQHEPAIVLERIVLWEKDKELPESIWVQLKVFLKNKKKNSTQIHCQLYIK